MKDQGKYGPAWIEGFTKAAMANGANQESTKHLLKVAALIDRMREPKFMEGFSKVAEELGADKETLLNATLYKLAAPNWLNAGKNLGGMTRRLLGNSADDIFRGASHSADDFARAAKTIDVPNISSGPVPRRMTYTPGGQGTGGISMKAPAPAAKAPKVDTKGIRPDLYEQAKSMGRRGVDKVRGIAGGGNAAAAQAPEASRSLLRRLLTNPVSVAGMAGGGVYGAGQLMEAAERNLGRDEHGRQYYDLMQMANEGLIPHEEATAMLRRNMIHRAKGDLDTLGYQNQKSFNPYVNWFGTSF